MQAPGYALGFPVSVNFNGVRPLYDLAAYLRGLQWPFTGYYYNNSYIVTVHGKEIGDGRGRKGFNSHLQILILSVIADL